MLSWYLQDADPIAAANPYTFYKPSRELIARVRPGEVVKLIFALRSRPWPPGPAAERMWVLVDELLPGGGFRGRLDNSPRVIRSLRPKDPVVFEACHIIDTQHDDPDNLVRQYTASCIVTQRVMVDRQPVRHLYREKANEANDSGWRLSANDESEQYLSEARNLAYVPLGVVLNLDDSFRHLLDAPVGAAFARDAASAAFKPE